MSKYFIYGTQLQYKTDDDRILFWEEAEYLLWRWYSFKFNFSF